MGGTVEVCQLAGTVDYTSIVFIADGTLYGHNAAAGRIDEINPCNCSFQIVGPTSLGTIALGQWGDDSDAILGLDPALDAAELAGEALVDALGLPLRIDHYEERATGSGANAQALAIVEAAMEGVNGATFGAGMSHNIVTASVQAIVSVANRLAQRLPHQAGAAAAHA